MLHFYFVSFDPFLGAALVTQGRNVKAASILGQQNGEEPCLDTLITPATLAGWVPLCPLHQVRPNEKAPVPSGHASPYTRHLTRDLGPPLTGTLGEIVSRSSDAGFLVAGRSSC